MSNFLNYDEFMSQKFGFIASNRAGLDLYGILTGSSLFPNAFTCIQNEKGLFLFKTRKF